MPAYYLNVSCELCSWKQLLVSLELTEGVLKSCLIEQGVLNSSRTAKTTKWQQCRTTSNQPCANLFSELDNSDHSCASKRQINSYSSGCYKINKYRLWTTFKTQGSIRSCIYQNKQHKNILFLSAKAWGKTHTHTHTEKDQVSTWNKILHLRCKS